MVATNDGQQVDANNFLHFNEYIKLAQINKLFLT